MLCKTQIIRKQGSLTKTNRTILTIIWTANYPETFILKSINAKSVVHTLI